MAVNRVTGFSNFDVEGMVKKMMDAEKVKLTKVQQNLQYREWEQDAFRSITDQLNAVKSEYFDVLKPESNLRSPTLFAKFSTSVKVNGTDSSKITVGANASIQATEQQIEYITQLASKDSYKSKEVNFSAILSKDLTADFMTDRPAVFKATLAIGSNSKTIEIDMDGIENLEDFKDAFNEAVTAQFGSGFGSLASVDGNQLKLKSAGNTVTLITQTNEANSMSWLGVSTGTSSKSYETKSLSDLLGITADNLQTMKINDKSLADMGVLTTDTVSKMVQKVNGANLGVTMGYDSVSDRFQVKSTKEGVANAVSLSAEFKDKMQINGGIYDAAKDAILSLNGTEIVQSSNSFTINGTNIKLNETHLVGDGPIKFEFKVDSDKIVDKIKGFIGVYNGLVESVSSKLSEKVFRSFTPLTDEQKEAMTEDQVNLWESKSKSGLLRNKGELQSILTKMRRALYDTVEGAGISLSQIGIETSSNYKENGKLIIKDENKLKSAIETNYSDVVKLFSNESDQRYLDSANSVERYRENGLGNRLYDIIQDAVRTTRDENGKKGTLLEVAGIKNDASDATSILSKKITEYEDRVATLLEYLADKENTYYATFSRVETALAKMESQGNYIASQLGG